MQVTVTDRELAIRMPKTLAHYTQNYLEMFGDAANAAQNAGYDVNSYNLYVVAFSYTPNMGWAGLAYVGGSGALINGSFNITVVAHELGHNYGLNHASFWRPTDTTTPIGQGSEVEYGDSFDMMGNSGSSQHHFNVAYKHVLNWLKDENLQTVTTGGEYQILAQDITTTLGGIRGLRIKKDNADAYWVEFVHF
jgi:hypothetical protein